MVKCVVSSGTLFRWLVIRAFAIRGFIPESWGTEVSFQRPLYVGITCGRRCHADALSCACIFGDSRHHFDSRYYKLSPLMVSHSENTRTFIRLPFYAWSRKLGSPGQFRSLWFYKGVRPWLFNYSSTTACSVHCLRNIWFTLLFGNCLCSGLRVSLQWIFVLVIYVILWNFAVEYLFMFHIQEVPVLDLCLGIDRTSWGLSWSFAVQPGKCRILKRPRSPSLLRTIHCHLIIRRYIVAPTGSVIK